MFLLIGSYFLYFKYLQKSFPPENASTNWYVSPEGRDSNPGNVSTLPFQTIQMALNLAIPGDTINLLPGVYLQDFITVRNGTTSSPITIMGPRTAIVEGAGSAHIVEIEHNYIRLIGFTVNGLWGDPGSASGYRLKTIYVQGKLTRSGVTGLLISNMNITNSQGECIRLRYFAQYDEIFNNSIGPCGINDFIFNGGGKNGEGVYIGTAPEQLGDGKNPTSDPDQSNYNWIHNNVVKTQGSECVGVDHPGYSLDDAACQGSPSPCPTWRDWESVRSRSSWGKSCCMGGLGPTRGPLGA